jgi:predicted nucleic acid-binding protein
VIFVDTGAWYADFVSDDPDHKAARTFLKENRERLVTTDHVIGETITLLRMRGRRARALHALKRLLSESSARVEWVKEADIREAFSVFQKFSDKEWSFTDCVSRVVMERLGLNKAFSFDHHFRQFGTVEVVP